MASHMKLGWRPSLEGAEVRKSLFDASFGFFYARAGLAKSWKFNISSTLIWGVGWRILRQHLGPQVTCDLRPDLWCTTGESDVWWPAVVWPDRAKHSINNAQMWPKMIHIPEISLSRGIWRWHGWQGCPEGDKWRWQKFPPLSLKVTKVTNVYI